MAEFDESQFAEETLDSQRVFEGRIVGVRVDTVRLPNGRESTREIVEHRGAAAAVPLLPGGRVALVRQWRQPLQKVLLEIPAGMLEQGENPQDCIRRELPEEIGYEAGRLELLFAMYVAPGYSQELLHIFLAEDLQPTQADADYDENVQVHILAFSEAVDRCLRGEIQDGKTIAGLLAVAAR